LQTQIEKKLEEWGARYVLDVYKLLNERILNISFHNIV